MTDDAGLKDELRSATEARKELGKEKEPGGDRRLRRADRGAARGEARAIAAIFTGLAGVIAVCAPWP
jgi:hypothetical protein